MDYRNFLAEDFASDDFFISCISGSDPTAKVFWESFLKNNPDKAFAIEEAKNMIELLQSREDELSDEEVSSMKDNILTAIREEKGHHHQGKTYTKSNRRRLFTMLRWAAIITLPLALLASVYFLSEKSSLATTCIG